jgi:MFS family permease
MRPFFVVWIGQLVSVVGSGMTGFALGIWIYQETGQATPFALTALFSTLPAVIIGSFAGALVDRWNRRRVMLVADTLAALATLAIALLFLTGTIQVWHIYVMAIIGSVAGAFQEPAFRASITMIVPREQITRASGLVETGHAVSSLVAPIVAGGLLVSIGMQGIILIDFVTYFFALAGLLLVRIPQPEASAEARAASGTVLKEAWYGWRYLFARSGLAYMLVYFAFVNFLLNMGGVVFTPITLTVANAAVVGIVQSVTGLAMLAGSVFISAWGGTKRRIYTVYGGIAALGLGMLIMGLYPSPWVIGAGGAVLMFALPVARAANQGIWQVKVAPDVQGRVFSARSVISRALMPVAYLLGGPLIDGFFEPGMAEGGSLAARFAPLVGGTGQGRGMALLLILMGMAVMSVTVLAFLNPRLRRVEIELPDIVVEPEAGEQAPEAEGAAVAA